MSETKFTPGSWKIVEDRVPSSLEVYGGTIAICECWRRANAETEMANAQLIAAAPEMYAVLAWLNCRGGLGLDAHKSIDAALAKARGEA
jgi:hypothetical protein